MTKEELEKEARINLKRRFGEYFPQLTISYVMGAEPRERRIEELEKENAELKDDNKVMADNYSKMEQKFYDNLTKAKEIIKKFLLWENDWHDKTESKYELLKQAEQFLKDCEVEI